MNIDDIKFKGISIDKEIDPGKWMFGYFWKEFDERTFIGADVGATWDSGKYRTIVLVDPKSVCQYTGLHDKKNIEIYNKDVLKMKMHNGTYENYVITWVEEDCQFLALNANQSNFIDPTIWHEAEVVGNIAKNPELMEAVY